MEALWEGCLAHSPQRASRGVTSSESKHRVPEADQVLPRVAPAEAEAQGGQLTPVPGLTQPTCSLGSVVFLTTCRRPSRIF